MHKHFKCVGNTTSIVDKIVATLLIPAYRFIFYPLLTTKLPSFVKQVEAGLFVWLISTLVNLSLDTVGHLHSNTTSCMFDMHSPGSVNTLPIPKYLLLIPDILRGMGNLMISCTALEFFMAQVPLFVRGTTMGVVSTLIFLGELIYEGIVIIISKVDMSMATPSCGFYYYLNPPNTVISTVHYYCQEIQAEREGEACQHTGHSRGALQEIL